LSKAELNVRKRGQPGLLRADTTDVGAFKSGAVIE
jgi:hypothetical protein